MTLARTESVTGREADLSLRWRTALWAYAVYASLLALVVWPSLASMAEQWISSSSFHHAPLAAPLALWLILRRADLTVAPRLFPPAALFIALFTTIWVIGRVVEANIIEHFAVVSLLIAGACMVFGVENAKLWALPFAFLFFTVPFGGSLTPALQEIAAAGSFALLGLFNLDAAREGLIITIGASAFRIAPSCSGLNFLLAALMVSTLFAAIALPDWRRHAGFVALAAIAAVAANILRVVTVILAATLTDGAYGLSADHIVFGWAFYAIMLFALVGVGRRLALRSGIEKA